MKKIFFIFLVICLFSVPAMAAKWTFMVYLDGDNNLEQAGVDDVNEMEKVGSTSDVNIVVLFDRAKGFDSSNGDWTTAKVARIVKDNDAKKMSSFASSAEDWGEADMGSKKTLTKFVKYAMKKYPAEKYALVLWNHGGGWRSLELMESASRGFPVSEPGFQYNYDEHVRLKLEMGRLMTISGARTICGDDSHGTILNTEDVRLALRDIPKLNLIGMDACLMAMVEVAYELRNKANVMVASEENEPGFGWPYDLLLKPLTERPSMNEVALGKIIVDSYGEYCDSHVKTPPPTQSAIRLSEMKNVANAVNRFVSSVPQKQKAGVNFVKIRNRTPSFARKDYIDYKNFLSKTPGTEGKSLAAAIDKAVIRNYSYKKGNATGLSIFFPGRAVGEYNAYKAKNIQFAKDTLWDDFLAYVHKGTPIPSASPQPSPKPSGKPSLTLTKLIAVKDRSSSTPASNINPGDTIYLKTDYRTAGIPPDHKELILWGMFDSNGYYKAEFERLQIEDSEDGTWSVSNRIKIPKNITKGRYYALCDIGIYSSAPEERANVKKIGVVPIGVDKSVKAAAPTIDRGAFDAGKVNMLNQGKLLIADAPRSGLNLKLAVNKPGKFPEYRVNEDLKIGIKVSKDAYFAMFTRQTDGKVSIIYPNAQNPSPSVRANQVTFFPPRGKGTLRIGPPAGTELIRVIASATPVTSASLDRYFRTGNLPFGGEWAEASLSIKIMDKAGPILDKTGESRDFAYSPSAGHGFQNIYNLYLDNAFPLKMAFNVQSERPVFRTGHTGLKIGIRPGANCYIALLHRNSEARVDVLMSGQNGNNYAAMNSTYYFPGADQGFLTVAPPYGVSEVKAIATLDRLDWNDPEQVYQYLTSNPGRWSGVVRGYEVK